MFFYGRCLEIWVGRWQICDADLFIYLFILGVYSHTSHFIKVFSNDHVEKKIAVPPHIYTSVKKGVMDEV